MTGNTEARQCKPYIIEARKTDTMSCEPAITAAEACKLLGLKETRHRPQVGAGREDSLYSTRHRQRRVCALPRLRA